jgi:predicted deacylase
MRNPSLRSRGQHLRRCESFCLPADRRDLNHSFSGTERGSLLGQAPDLSMTETVTCCDFKIDLHSAAIHLVNLPQIRVSKGQDTVLQHAMIFGSPVVVIAPLRQGSLRATAANIGVEVIVYEGGEAQQFDNTATPMKVWGILRVLRQMDMLRSDRIKPVCVKPYVVSNTAWLRAPTRGVIQLHSGIGKMVFEREIVGVVTDPLGEYSEMVNATRADLIIGQDRVPSVNQGGALLYIAKTDHVGRE